MEMQDVLTTVNGEPITVEDAIVRLKANGNFRNAIYQLIESRVIALKCQELGIGVRENELHAHSETKRRLLGLFRAMDMNRYCKWHGITMEHWNATVQQEVLRRKLNEALIEDFDVEEYFEQNKNKFMMASLSRIVCAEFAEARKAKDRIVNGVEDFATVARDVSREKNTRRSGGYLGCIKFGTLAPTINEAVFSASPGEILGPFEQSGYWVLYRVEERRNPELDESLRKNISDQLFSQWLRKEALNAKA